MATQLLIYDQVEAVNKKRHLDWSIKPENNYAFAKSVNSVPLMAVEFPHAAEDYTIVFAGEGEQLLPVVIMGIRDNENLYVNSQGEWAAQYVPAFVRRYPFVFATADQGKTLTLCLDESYKGCNQEDLGERLFDGAGEQTQYLNKVIDFLQDYQGHYQRTQAFSQKLVELDLLEEMGAKFTLANGEQRTLTGFKVINKQKLKALTDEQVAQLFKTDALELIYLHLNSMRNLQKMLKNAPVQEEAQAENKTESTVH